MAASVWACLMLCIANVRSGLLPVPTGLLNLGVNGPNGGLLSTLGGVIYTGLDAVDSLGQGLLGKLIAQSDKHETNPSKDIYLEEPWKVNFSYEAYQRDAYNILKNEGRLISYAEWINKIHGDVESVYDYDSLKKYLRQEQNSEKTKGLHLPNHEIVKAPLKNVLTLQNNLYTTTVPTPGIHNNNQFVTSQLSGSQQPNDNGVYVILNSNSNLGDQGTPNTPTVYKDNEGNLYQIIQANVNEVNRLIQPSPLKTQVYTLMNLNQNQGSRPVSYIATKPIEIIALRVESNPNNVYTPGQIQNPDVNYVTTPNYVSDGKTVTEKDQEVVNPPNGNEYDDTRDETEVLEETKETALNI